MTVPNYCAPTSRVKVLGSGSVDRHLGVLSTAHLVQKRLCGVRRLHLPIFSMPNSDVSVLSPSSFVEAFNTAHRSMPNAYSHLPRPPPPTPIPPQYTSSRTRMKGTASFLTCFDSSSRTQRRKAASPPPRTPDASLSPVREPNAAAGYSCTPYRTVFALYAVRGIAPHRSRLLRCYSVKGPPP